MNLLLPNFDPTYEWKISQSFGRRRHAAIFNEFSTSVVTRYPSLCSAPQALVAITATHHTCGWKWYRLQKFFPPRLAETDTVTGWAKTVTASPPCKVAAWSRAQNWFETIDSDALAIELFYLRCQSLFLHGPWR